MRVSKLSTHFIKHQSQLLYQLSQLFHLIVDKKEIQSAFLDLLYLSHKLSILNSNLSAY